MRIVESNINKKIKSKVRSKEMILVAIIMGIFLFILFTGFAYSGRRNDYTYSNNIRYSSIRIEEGDTLSDIATRYMPDGVSEEDYINNLMSLNCLTNYKLNTGRYLIIYYYTY
ncbi:LysM peptidoglycan-binding domain-containing protein [Falcatimonas sp. MSJ-15]|uniref:LysM peptidoglycan-binding domain-containing protein n=1 Tax=Falcatimonas sp. MSJ-15 TaxID=2841515 RepID=UPI001C1055C6|nr:LysM peptidoglycan-binding domain-containing protein [Falcatimonas sp. MSJ-15]MBU5470294.1 LysM peptidoglycan-binding domain-containing protein [Falcatimonas sp. MSJ-15]